VLIFSCGGYCSYLLLSFLHAGLGLLGCRGSSLCPSQILRSIVLLLAVGCVAMAIFTRGSCLHCTSIGRGRRFVGGGDGIAADVVPTHSCASHSCGLQLHKSLLSSLLTLVVVEAS
jgi:hypothetical protein